MPVFFVEPGAIQNNLVTITGALGHHLIDSLRIQPGEAIWLAEPGGIRYEAKVLSANRGQLTGEILSSIQPPSRTSPRIILGIGLIKSDHMDWAVQKATELGVGTLVPLITSRSVIRPRPERIVHQQSRWQSIAREAAQQSMGWDIPEVMAPRLFEDWCARQEQVDCRLLLWEGREGLAFRQTLRNTQKPQSVAIGIGPEGGFDEKEVEQAQRVGYQVVSLGKRILRTESAVVAAVAIIQYEWGDLG